LAFGRRKKVRASAIKEREGRKGNHIKEATHGEGGGGGGNEG